MPTYNEVESTGWKILNIRDPRKQTLAVVFVVAVIFGIGFGLAAKLMYDVMNKTNQELRSDIKDRDRVIARKDSIIESRDEKHNQSIERLYNKALGVEEKVNELTQKVAK